MPGLGLPQPPPAALPAPPGTRLLMVTDSLVEVRNTNLDTSLTELHDTVADGATALEGTCDLLLDRFGQNKDDDIALITASFG
ncbi:SpoIIE family protein phosphatase [Streptomyces sp. NPDC090493]|uniref:SpoIIE family protein phosphatase n=1 Tax=Streptomyces sp. NPDC090493 TaxID=3365964 RepID=UPI0038236777